MKNHPVIIYTKNYCLYCEAAKRLLSGKGVAFEERNVTEDEAVFQELTLRTAHATVPQVFVGERFLGGFEELKSLDISGQLDEILGTTQKD